MDHLKPFEDRKQLFFDKAYEKYGDRYSYESFEYTNAKTKSIIMCPKHGEFEQSPDRHLRSPHACPGCLSVRKSELRAGKPVAWTRPFLDVSDYLERLNLPDRYEIDTSEYIGLSKGSVTLTCPDHGSVIYAPQALLQSKYKCKLCAREYVNETNTASFDDFKEVASRRYSNKYVYPDQEFVNRLSKVTIICPDHGEFIKVARVHIAGQECYQCTLIRGIVEGKYPGGYCQKTLAENPELASSPAFVYYLEIGGLYKVGITTKSVERRAKQLRSSSKKQVQVLDSFACTLGEAFELESMILDKFQDTRVRRSWSTELFSADILADTTLEQQQKLGG